MVTDSGEGLKSLLYPASKANKGRTFAQPNDSAITHKVKTRRTENNGRDIKDSPPEAHLIVLKGLYASGAELPPALS